MRKLENAARLDEKIKQRNEICLKAHVPQALYSTSQEMTLLISMGFICVMITCPPERKQDCGTFTNFFLLIEINPQTHTMQFFGVGLTNMKPK